MSAEPSNLQLPKGITGCGAPASVDIRSFRRDLFTAARNSGVRVDRPPPREVKSTFNYVEGRVSFRDRTWRLLLNVYHPYIGFAELDDGPLGLEFVDCDALADCFPNYVVLPASVLNASPPKSALALLHDVEQEEIRYWQPDRIGDVVFNFWD